jgi:hypothetical protein
LTEKREIGEKEKNDIVYLVEKQNTRKEKKKEN